MMSLFVARQDTQKAKYLQKHSPTVVPLNALLQSAELPSRRYSYCIHLRRGKVSDGEVPSKTFILCGIALCPADPSSIGDPNSGISDTNIVTIPPFTPLVTIDSSVTDSADSSNNSFEPSNSSDTISSSNTNVSSVSNSNNNTSIRSSEETSNSSNTATSGESSTYGINSISDDSNYISDSASGSESDSNSDSSDIISDSMLSGSSVSRSNDSHSITSNSNVETCTGNDCPSSVTMCGTSICPSGENNVTICPDKSVYSIEGEQIYIMCGTAICQEPPLFTITAPFWWHHHDHHQRPPSSFEKSEHYHQVHGIRILP